jgi:hypothetical protein
MKSAGMHVLYLSVTIKNAEDMKPAKRSKGYLADHCDGKSRTIINHAYTFTLKVLTHGLMKTCWNGF